MEDALIDREFFYGEWEVAPISRPTKIRSIYYYLPNGKWEMQLSVTARWRPVERFMQIVDAAHGGEWDLECDESGDTLLVLEFDLERESTVEKVGNLFMGIGAKVAFMGAKALSRDAGRGHEMKSKGKVQRVSESRFVLSQALVFNRRLPRRR